jgi:hypothetical protein
MASVARWSRQSLLVHAAVLTWAVLPFSPAYATTVTVIVQDSAGEGFNDPTAVAPIGGNPGTTIGAQRLNAFQHAANLWAARIVSPVEIRIGARFDPQACDATSAILGSAGPNSAFRDFAGAPVANTWYPVALANALSGADLAPGAHDISATFNSTFGTTCPFPRAFYYGLDGNPGSNVDFVSIVLHELGHGLGFTTFVNLSTGAKLLGFDDTYMRNLERHGGSPASYPAMSNAQRVAANTDTGNLHWVGPNVASASGGLTAGTVGDHVRMYAPDSLQPGSSVAHWDTVLSPNQLMEPSYTEPTHHPVLDVALFQDIGWAAAPPPAPAIVTPAPGSTLTSNNVLFTGGHTGSDLQHWIYVGTTPGNYQILTQDLGTGHAVMVSGLPNSGTIYVRYWTRFAGGWQLTDQQYTMNVTAPSAPPIVSPTPGSTLTSDSVTFTGGHTGSDLQHWLYVGTTPGNYQIFTQDLGTGHGAMVNGLPNSGTIYLRYWTRFADGWHLTDQQYTMNVTAPSAPFIVSPAPGSTLTSNSVMFTGGHTGSDLQHWLYVGTTPGNYQIFTQDLGTGHGAMVNGLPDSGTIYLRYWTRFADGWHLTDQQYTMSVP